MRIPLFLVLFTGIILTSCKQAGPANEADNTEDFPAFYKRFHQDSAFQMSRISFPLEGLPERADSAVIASGTFRWEKENWKIQKAFTLQNSEFEQSFLPIGEDMIIEKLTHKKWGLAITRRFAKLDDGWNLIYYSGLNKFEQPADNSGIQITSGYQDSPTNAQE
jgi:hypothetical protein